MTTALFEPLGEIVGDFSRIGYNIALSSLPLHLNYIVDMMIYPTRAAALLRYFFWSLPFILIKKNFKLGAALCDRGRFLTCNILLLMIN